MVKSENPKMEEQEEKEKVQLLTKPSEGHSPPSVVKNRSPMKEDVSALCGLGSWRPRCLQRFNSTKGFLVVYGLLGTIQAMSYIYFVATLTTLEKRFKISSRTTGLMMSGNEISQVMLSLVLSYYGGQRNRPLWIAWGVAFSAASCYILAMPHFLYGPGEDALALTKEYSHGVNTTALIISKEQASLCDRTEDDLTKCDQGRGGEFSNIPALLVFLSQFVLGIGTTLYYALGQTYLDDNAKKSKTPLLLSLTMSLRTIGPAIGFVVGYGCLRLYIAPTLTPIITNKDPRWLGAWWLGWIILGTAMLLFSALIAMFPKKLPANKSKVGAVTNGEVITLETVKQAEKPQFVNGVSREKLVEDVEKEDLPSMKEFPAALKRLLKNKLLMANILGGVFYILGGSAYITYITKYMEIQFHQTAAGASFIIGPTAILSMTAGFLLSGAVISKFKPRPLYLLSWNVIVGFSFVLGEIAFIFLSCEDSNMVGFRKGDEGLNLMNECNRECGCGGLKFNPVCLEKAELTFYTACHAGCQNANYSVTPITYKNCSCIPDDVMEFLYQKKEEVVLKTGACRGNCYYNFVIFIAITMIMHGLGSSGKIGNVLVNYRSVAAVDKSFAQGLGLLMVSLFAFIPGPILFGIIIDSTCMVWDETCGRRGNCWLYNKDNLRFMLNSISACLTLIGVLFDALVCYLGRDLKLYEDDEEDTNKNSVSLAVNGKTEIAPAPERLEKS